MATNKKVVKAEDIATDAQKQAIAASEKNAKAARKQADAPEFVPTAEAKSKATTLRVVSILMWAAAIGCEAFAIFYVLRHPPVNMVLLIILLVVDLGLTVGANLLWKKANRLDPASEKNGFKFFVQNQLGAIISIIAFLPLIILIFLDKDMDGKQKGIAGAIGIVALLVAGATGISLNPPSSEQYAEQTSVVQALTGQNQVYWTKSGTKYHLYDDCQHINTAATEEIYSGTVAEARELKNITELCKTCEGRAEKANPDASLPAAADEDVTAEDVTAEDADADTADADTGGAEADAGTDEDAGDEAA